MARSVHEEGRALGPWHLGVQITKELNTSDLQPEIAPHGHSVHLIDPTAKFTELLRRLFPNGLEGRSVLDCACNCGAYLFLCKDHGAGECLGFDVRDSLVNESVPPHSKVAVLADVVPELPYRETFAFDPGEDFRAALAVCGGDYLLTAGQGLHRANETGLMDYLVETFSTAGQDPPHAVIHDLGTRRASAS